MGHLSFFFPIIQPIMSAMPLSWLKALNPFAHALMLQKDDVGQRVRGFLVDKRSETGCVMESICSPSMPPHMLDVKRLTNEGFAMTIAGTETTARSLSIGVYHLYSNDRVRAKLRDELRSIMPTPDSRPSWSQLEKLPYLTGVVYVSLRFSTGISGRSPRIAPTESLVYQDFVIPPGVRKPTPPSQIS